MLTACVVNVAAVCDAAAELDDETAVGTGRFTVTATDGRMASDSGAASDREADDEDSGEGDDEDSTDMAESTRDGESDAAEDIDDAESTRIGEDDAESTRSGGDEDEDDAGKTWSALATKLGIPLGSVQFPIPDGHSSCLFSSIARRLAARRCAPTMYASNRVGLRCCFSETKVAASRFWMSVVADDWEM